MAKLLVFFSHKLTKDQIDGKRQLFTACSNE